MKIVQKVEENAAAAVAAFAVQGGDEDEDAEDTGHRTRDRGQRTKALAAERRRRWRRLGTLDSACNAKQFGMAAESSPDLWIAGQRDTETGG